MLSTYGVLNYHYILINFVISRDRYLISTSPSECLINEDKFKFLATNAKLAMDARQEDEESPSEVFISQITLIRVPNSF